MTYGQIFFIVVPLCVIASALIGGVLVEVVDSVCPGFGKWFDNGPDCRSKGMIQFIFLVCWPLWLPYVVYLLLKEGEDDE